MVLFSVEPGQVATLGEGHVEVRGPLRHDLFAPFEHFRLEHATPIPGDEHHVDREIMGDAATTSLGFWLPQGCRRPALRWVP